MVHNFKTVDNFKVVGIFKTVDNCKTFDNFKMVGNFKTAHKFKTDLKLETSGATNYSLGTSFGFDVTAVDFSKARSVRDVLHITIMSVELHIETRQQLKPDPQFDMVAAIFTTVHSMGLKDDFQTFCFWICTSRDPRDVGRPYENVHFSFGHPYVEVRVSTEKELFEKFEKVVAKNDPDILVGYELELLSWGYLFDRAHQVGYDLRSRCSRILEQRRYQRSTMVNSWSLVDVLNVTGRVALNLWVLMKNVVTLRCYAFENVAFHVLHMRVPLYTTWQLTEWFKVRKSRWRVFHYYFVRTVANVQLLISRDIVNRTAEMARLYGIQFLAVLSRGSQFRVESMMLRMAKAEGYVALSPTPEQRRNMNAPECIALNMEPESMFCSYPVLVLDFQSLYPSICIAYNYCFSTCLGKATELCSDERFQFGCSKLKVPFNILSELRQHLVCSPAGVVFVDSTVRRGILPQMLEEILNTRAMVKKCMKEYVNDKALVKVLDARQMGLKLIANVTYGYTSANYSGRMPCVEIADSIVQKGRETLEAAIKMVNSNKLWNARVVYGDTDSMFVALPGRSKEEAFRIGAEIAAAVTEVNPYPVKLKFEKVYLPCVLQTKKRYVGYAYESVDQKEPIFDAKGIETVRRDTCPLVSKVLKKALIILFDSGNVDKVERYLTVKFEDVLSGAASFEDFIFAKEYRGRSWYQMRSAVPSLSIARKRLAQDGRSEPRIGERVPYVIVCGEPRSTLISCVREPQEVMQNPSLNLNYVYYVVRQLVPALNRVFNLFNRDCHDIFIRLSGCSAAVMNKRRRRRNFGSEKGMCQSTLSQFVQIYRCPICSEPTVADMCSDCTSDPVNSYVTLQYQMTSVEREVSLWSVATMQPRALPNLEDFENRTESQLIDLIISTVNNPSLYCFGELLALPCVNRLANSETAKKYHNLLTLFAYGTYRTFLSKKELFPPLTGCMVLKLRQLTIVSLAARKTEVPYSELFAELDLDSRDIRSLEDIIIDAIYNNLLVAKMDQCARKLIVKWNMGRDVHPKELGALIECLNGYATVCEETVVEMKKETAVIESSKLNGLNPVENEPEM
uniref:DNA polymerase n=1 Tax=Trichuris muris TaxID=70415 RepID=A0A5S6QH45_TRIMR